VVCWCEISIRSLVWEAASEQRPARLRTSSATTEKPAPASPARAASTAALRARRLVCVAMSLIPATIASVALALVLRSIMVLFS